MQQLLVLTDDNGRILGTATRKECHYGKGRRHWGFILLVKNSEGKFILCKRADTKSCGPGLWDASVVSHVLPDETAQAAAIRRAGEELHISVTNIVDHGGFVYEASYGEYSENEYCSVLVGQSHDEPVANPEEISEIMYKTSEELQKGASENESLYAPWLTIPLKKFAF